jgi:hypothetical protein
VTPHPFREQRCSTLFGSVTLHPFRGRRCCGCGFGFPPPRSTGVFGAPTAFPCFLARARRSHRRLLHFFPFPPGRIRRRRRRQPGKLAPLSTFPARPAPVPTPVRHPRGLDSPPHPHPTRSFWGWRGGRGEGRDLFVKRSLPSPPPPGPSPLIPAASRYRLLAVRGRGRQKGTLGVRGRNPWLRLGGETAIAVAAVWGDMDVGRRWFGLLGVSSRPARRGRRPSETRWQRCVDVARNSARRHANRARQAFEWRRCFLEKI